MNGETSGTQDIQAAALSPEAAEAVAAICLMAAFADGDKSELEQAHLKDIFQSLGTLKTAALYQRVLLGGTTIEDELQDLKTPELRRFVFELALSICDADGATNEAEATFLERLRYALELPSSATSTAQQHAETLAELPVETPLEPLAAHTDTPPTPTEAPVTANTPTDTSANDAELDKLILNAAILNGGLELLPQTLATVAIVPLQLRMVYQIGQANGYQLGREHLKEFLTIAGVGMTSQVVEGHLRKLFGGLAKKTAGKGAKRLAQAATGAAMSFATTYALGQAAKRYYGGGRKLSISEVRDIFKEQVERGQALFERHRGDVQNKAKTINVQSLLKLVRP